MIELTTPVAIFLTQIPIALAIIYAGYQFQKANSELVKLLEKISKNKRK
jgi:hypothetical protein